MSLTLLTLALTILQIMDWYSTRTILNNGGTELNPLARAGIALLGLDEFLLIKAVVVTIAGYEIGAAYLWALAVLVIWYAAVMAFNWRSLLSPMK